MPESIEKASWFDPTWKGGSVSPRAYAVLAPNASWETFEGTNTWILHDDGCERCYVVDPGPDDAEHLQRVAEIACSLAQRVTAILLTHEHIDHAQGASALADMLSVPVLSRVNGNLPDGPLYMQGAPQVEVVSLPGHSSDSVGFVFPADSSIVTGDVILWQASTAIIWPDGNLRQYMESLVTLKRMVLDGSCTRFLTAHRRPVDDCLGTIEKYLAHRTMRLDMVRQAVRDVGSADMSSLISRVYGDVDAQYHALYSVNLRAQLAYLEETNDPCMQGESEASWKEAPIYSMQ